MPYSGALQILGVVSRNEDVSRTVPFVPYVPLFLQQSQHAADRRVTRLIGKVGQDFGRRRTLSADEDVHDLAFAATQLCERLDHIYGIVLVR